MLQAEEADIELAQMKMTVQFLTEGHKDTQEVVKETNRCMQKLAKSLDHLVATTEKFEIRRDQVDRRLDKQEEIITKLSERVGTIEVVSMDNKFVAATAVKIASVIFTAFMAGGIGLIWALFKTVVEPLARAG